MWSQINSSLMETNHPYNKSTAAIYIKFQKNWKEMSLYVERKKSLVAFLSWFASVHSRGNFLTLPIPSFQFWVTSALHVCTNILSIFMACLFSVLPSKNGMLSGHCLFFVFPNSRQVKMCTFKCKIINEWKKL